MTEGRIELGTSLTWWVFGGAGGLLSHACVGCVVVVGEREVLGVIYKC